MTMLPAMNNPSSQWMYTAANSDSTNHHTTPTIVLIASHIRQRYD